MSEMREHLLKWLAQVEENIAGREAIGADDSPGYGWLESTRDGLREVLEGRPVSEDWSDSA